ncbi:MAG: preprotein translocase subunit SecG [Verrucomicrobiota bacterium]
MPHIARRMSILISLLTVVLIIVCLLLIVIVMMQRPRQEGLGAAFGGGMTDQMFGAQTTNVLQKGTVYLAVAFFVISLLLAILMAKDQGRKASLPEGLTESDPLPVLEAPATGITIDDPLDMMGEGEPGAVDGDVPLNVPSVMMDGEANAAEGLGLGEMDVEESASDGGASPSAGEASSPDGSGNVTGESTEAPAGSVGTSGEKVEGSSDDTGEVEVEEDADSGEKVAPE